MKLATKILQGIHPLIKVYTYPLTEGNNRYFSRGSPTEHSLFLVYLGNKIGLPLETIWFDSLF